MSILVTGPTGSGKSTLMHSPEMLEFLPSDSVPPNAVYGYQLIDEEVPEYAFVHYNLLHPALTVPKKVTGKAGLPCNLMSEPIFKKIIASRRIRLAIVLVSPLQELLQRAEIRTRTEETIEGLPAYDAKLWQHILASTNLAAVYEKLFLHLDEVNLPYIVVYSSAKTPARFSRSDRVFIPANLRGEFSALPSSDDVATILKMPGCHYQSVLLPHGVVTDKGGYPHIIHGRHESFEAILSESLWNTSVLDIGCALGDLLYRAERVGARRIVGVESHLARFEAAVAITRLLGSRAELNHCDFMDMKETETFDHVFILNVIHHVKNFYAFLKKACRLAEKSVVIEFPTLRDGKFAEANGYPLLWILDRLPLIGVSSRSVDQTYVFSPKAIERICRDQIGGFKRVYRFKSPLKNRCIMVFER